MAEWCFSCIQWYTHANIYWFSYIYIYLYLLSERDVCVCVFLVCDPVLVRHSSRSTGDDGGVGSLSMGLRFAAYEDVDDVQIEINLTPLGSRCDKGLPTRVNLTQIGRVGVGVELSVPVGRCLSMCPCVIGAVRARAFTFASVLLCAD